jgi:hypothetical protein
MGRAVKQVLPFAIGVAISPIPIIAVILMLFSNRANVNGPVFLLRWGRRTESAGGRRLRDRSRREHTLSDAVESVAATRSATQSSRSSRSW